MTNEEKERLKALASKWQSMQGNYLRIAANKTDARQTAKFNGKAQGLIDCGTDLRKLIKELNQ